MIVLRTLGALEVTANQVAVRLPKKAIALLAMIADAGSRGVLRTEVGATLWPSSSDADHSINQALHDIRKTLGRAVLRSHGGWITLGTSIRYDYQEALNKLRGGDPIAASSLVEGPFLSSIASTFGDAFDDWRTQREAYLLNLLKSGLKDALQAARVERRWNHLNDSAAQGVRLFGDDADFQMALAESLARAGAFAEARETYAKAVSELSTAVAFDQWLDALLPSSPARPPLIGRDREIRRLRSYLEPDSDNSTHVVLVKGHPGIGKSRLVDHVLSSDIRRDNVVISAKGRHAEEGIAYNILAELVRQAARHASLESIPQALADALLEIVPDLAVGGDRPIPRLNPEAAKLRLFEAASRLIFAASAAAPAIMFVDDLQWVDDVSLEWLVFLCRRLDNTRVDVIGASRFSPAPKIALELESMEGAQVIELQPLSEEAIRELVRTHGHGTEQAALAAQVYDVTRGNPLLAVEFIRHAKTSAPAAEEVVGLPFLKRELHRLSEAARAIIEASAVLGHAPKALLARIAGVSPSQIANCWAELSPYLVYSPDDSLDLYHDLIGESVYGLIPTIRKHELHNAAAEALLAESGDPGMIAEHYAKAGNKALTVRYALEAAARRERAGAFNEAVQFLELAIETSEGKSRADLIARLAEVMFRGGLFESAVPILAQLAEHSRDPRTRLDWRWRYVHACAASDHLPPKEILKLTETLLAEAESHQHVKAMYQALTTQLTLGVQRRENDRYVDSIPRLVELADRHPLTEEGAGSLRLAGFLLCIFEGASTGRNLLQKAIDWSAELGLNDLLITSLRALAYVDYLAGDLDLAEANYAKALNLIDRFGAVLYQSYVDSALGDLMLERGLFERSILHIDRADAAQTHMRTDVRQVSLVVRSTIAWLTGDYQQSVGYAARAMDLAPSDTWIHGNASALRGLAALELGEVSIAKAIAENLERNVFENFPGDVSHVFLLIARVAVLGRREKEVIGLLRKVAAHTKTRDYVGSLRVQLALAEALARSDSAEALSLCDVTLDTATTRGLGAVAELSRISRRRIQRLSRR